MKRVVIVGAGIAGLTVAYRLRGKAAVTLLDERDRLGGVILTEHHEGFLIEGGPDSILATKPWGVGLLRELGLEASAIRPRSKVVHVWSRGRLRVLPEGVFLTVPTRVWPFLTSSLISILGKLRMGLDLVLPRGPEVEDESLASFVKRRLGREALDKIAEPLMAGIYLASAEKLSLRATFPRFLELEREHRSLIRGLRQAMPAKPGGSVSPFVSLAGGLGELVDALAKAIDATVRTRATVTSVAPGVVRTGDGEIPADAVVVAVPPPRAAALVGGRLGDAISKIQSIGSTTVSLGFRDVALPDGTGFVIPRAENRRIAACTWSSRKFEGRAPEGHVLVRCFLAGTPSDAVSIAREEVRALMGIDREPVVARAYAWPGANPIYEVGHLARVREIDALTPPGIFLTGAGFRGIGIPDGVHDATETAARIIALP